MATRVLLVQLVLGVALLLIALPTLAVGYSPWHPSHVEVAPKQEHGEGGHQGRVEQVGVGGRRGGLLGEEAQEPVGTAHAAVAGGRIGKEPRVDRPERKGEDK